MCYVAPADVGEVDDDSRGSLIAVTSTGGVHVWGAPSIENVQGDGARLPLEVPLLATHSVRVRDGSTLWGHHPMLRDLWCKTAPVAKISFAYAIQ